MQVISKDQFLKYKARYFRKIMEGAVFIYPTDTIYGIGCDATNAAAVRRVRQLKNRSQAPFSVAVPSKIWIKDNCIVSKQAETWLHKLPGPYTLLLKLKNKKAVARAVIPETNILGIRMPKNWFAKIVKELDMPIVSTSANITAQRHMSSLKDLNPRIANKVDFIVYDGKKKTRPSKVIKFSRGKTEILAR